MPMDQPPALRAGRACLRCLLRRLLASNLSGAMDRAGQSRPADERAPSGALDHAR